MEGTQDGLGMKREKEGGREIEDGLVLYRNVE